MWFPDARLRVQKFVSKMLFLIERMDYNSEWSDIVVEITHNMVTTESGLPLVVNYEC